MSEHMRKGIVHWKALLLVPIFAAMPTVIGCASQTQSPKPSNLTAGMAKKTITKGTTTQAEVMEVFGPPDMVTHRDGQQIWTYDKVRYDVESSSGYLTVLLAGVGSSRTRSASTSTMLIIYFDERDVVRDYRLNVTRF